MPPLTPLVPTFLPLQHGAYSRELIELLTDDERRARVWNIALTGAYGSGKSSVLAEVTRQLRKRVVQISLSSLKDVGVQPSDQGDELNNYIQKEIVKQLLYRELPRRLPSSRFQRISRPSVARAAGLGVLAGGLVAIVLWIAGWQGPFPSVSESEWWLRPALIAGTGAAFATIVAGATLLFHNRIRISELGTSATSVKLTTDADVSYFDEYLDEIVYFFEMTHRDIVIIEDLDRFENPGIFASLRELNTVLNSSEQLRTRPIHFVYAVRDSIFEDLEPTPRDSADGEVATAQTPVWQAQRRLSDAATQRTKFFDLVIAIVPFITHRSSTDLLVEALRPVDPTIGREVIRTVAQHITDMRLLTNIVNEYRTFRGQILDPGELHGLSPSNLFALVAYKNTHLRDFEQIRVGASNLDVLYRTSRRIIGEGLGRVGEQIRAAERPDRADPAIAERANYLGRRMQDLLSRWVARLGWRGYEVTYRVADQDWTSEQVLHDDFWQAFLDGTDDVRVLVGGEPRFTIDRAELKLDLGVDLPESWSASTSRQQADEIERLRTQQQWFRSADFAQLLAPPYELTLAGEPVRFADEVSLVTKNDPLTTDLLAGGLLDRNFPLYASRFYGVVASANATTFDVQHLQTEVPDFRYTLTEADVDSILTSNDDSIFESRGIYNIAIYDRLLESGDARLDYNLRLIANSTETDIAFVTAYLADGAHGNELVRRLAFYWPGIFSFLDARSQEATETLGDLDLDLDLDVDLELDATRGVNPALTYQISEAAVERMGRAYVRIPELTTPTISTRAVVSAFERLGVRVPSFDQIHPAAAEMIIDSRTYKVNVSTLEHVIGDGKVIALDAVLRRGGPLFDHVMHNFDDYLSALDSSERSSVDSQDEIVPVLEAVDAVSNSASRAVEQRLPSGMTVDSIADAPDSLLPVLAAGRRFPLTLSNIDSYIENVGMDDDLVSYLEDARSLERNHDDDESDETTRTTLAAHILAEARLSVPARVLLAQQLVSDLAVGFVTSREPNLIVGLVDAGLIDNDPATFQAFADSVDAQEAFAVSSHNLAPILRSAPVRPELLVRLLTGDRISHEDKQLIAEDVPANPSWQTPDVLEAVAEWAVYTDASLPLETMNAVQASSVPSSTKLTILNTNAPGLTAELMSGYLSSLPNPHGRLVERSHTPVDLPLEPNVDAVLALLHGSDGSAVSSVVPMDGFTRVYMRHP